MSQSNSEAKQKSILSFFSYPKTSIQKSNPSISTSKKRTLSEMNGGETMISQPENIKTENVYFPASSYNEKILEIPIISNNQMKTNNEEEKIIYSAQKKKKIIVDDNEDTFDTPRFKNNQGTSVNVQEQDLDISQFSAEKLEEGFQRNSSLGDMNLIKNFSLVQVTSASACNKIEKGQNINQNQTRPVSSSTSSQISKKPPIGKRNSTGDTKKSNSRKTLIDNEDDEEDDKENKSYASDASFEELDLFTTPENGLPDFLKTENIRDKNGRKPDDPNYDPTTLLVPMNYLKKQTPAMQQFWKFKEDTFDKVLFFKLGKFYEMFYDDAIVGNQVLDLNWMGNDPKKLHVGFPEKILEEKAGKLVDAGFKVAVVEQMETPEQLQERVKSNKSEVKEKCVKRELCNVFTKGTYMNTSGIANDYNNKYCIALACNDNSANYTTETHSINSQGSTSSKHFHGFEWGFLIFDVTTLKFFTGQLKEDQETESFNKLMTLLYSLKPDEVIVMRNNIPSYAINFIKSLSCKPQITYLKNDYNVLNLNRLCSKHFSDNLDDWNKTILDLVSNEESNKFACCALYIAIIYLEKILLADQCLTIASIERYNENINLKTKSSLIMDYQVATNLELTETKLDPKNPEAGSLLEYMNRAVTQFGKRLFRSWLLNPLADILQINDRLDMVDDLINNPDLLNILRNSLIKWPDIERQCSKIYKFAMNNATQAIYFEDIGKSRLQEFCNVINFFKKSIELFNIFSPFLEENKIKSKLLHKITLSQNEECSDNCAPNIKLILDEISENFQLKEEEKGNVIVEAREGICPEYDAYKDELETIYRKFDEILAKERKRLKCAIVNYAHTKFFKYEIEVPEEYVTGNKRPNEYKLTTSKKGYLRFHTNEILENVKKMEMIQEKMKEETKKFTIILFKQFYLKSKIINDYISNIAELDCLQALAIVSIGGSEGTNSITCRPKFLQTDATASPTLHLIKSRHPCLSSRTSFFVPNDVVIGNSGKSSIVITGPNMGGKSTLLRQVCICVIMAQMGCYVPAESCTLTPVDRIFTRIGAKDKILEGKSTFFIEMEETKNILLHATRNSLVIMDELGRGTSTKDGMIIAKTILDRLEKRIQCRTLFTTHYHELINWCGLQNGIDLYFMDSVVNKETKDITFLYKFRQGICPKSYGINVAKLAGLPESIIQLAADISESSRAAKDKIMMV